WQGRPDGAGRRRPADRALLLDHGRGDRDLTMAQTSIQETLERIRTLAERSGAAEAETYYEFITLAEARVREREVELIEENAIARDQKIQTTLDTRAGYAVGEVHFSNTFIPYQVFRSTNCWLTCTAVATDGKQKREGSYSDRKRVFLDLNTPERIGRKAA